MGNQHSTSHHNHKPRKNVHWKSAGRPAAPGKPEIIPILSEDEPNAVTLRWAAGAHDGGAPLHGYQVECNRLGAPDWIRTAPPVVLRPELVLTGLEPPHRYQFRVAALNAVGRSDYSDLSDVLTVSAEAPPQRAPVFLVHLMDVTVLENDKTEFRVKFEGAPTPTIAWFKDDYEIFSSRRTAIVTDESSSVLSFHQTQASDEGEIRCTATNRGGHAVTRARLAIEAAPKLRYPRQYEDGLLYEVNETVFLKTTIVGKPAPTIEWRHDGQPLVSEGRIDISNTGKFSVLKIHGARRSDRGEYQVHARNSIGEDSAAFLVTITAPPEPPRAVSVARQVDKSVTLDWQPPEDDGGCRIGNYVVEYYRAGWNVWLKATTSRKTNVTLFELIEGSEYRFRVKAESPYGMSAPSEESAPVRIPGRAVDMEFLAVESRIISEALAHEAEERVSPAPRRKRTAPPPEPPPAAPQRAHSNENLLVLSPDMNDTLTQAEKRNSFQLDWDSISPPPLSLSAPDISSRCIMPFKALRNSVSSTELLHERAMARFYKAVAIQEEQSKKNEKPSKQQLNDIPNNTSIEQHDRDRDDRSEVTERESHSQTVTHVKPEIKPPKILIKTDSIEDKEYNLNERQASQDSEASDPKWQQNMSFDEDYTASTVSSDEDFSEGSLNGDMDRRSQFSNDDTYNPRDKMARRSSLKSSEELSESPIPVKPLPVIDPNFVPKPILKKREVTEIKPTLTIPKYEEKLKPERKSKKDEKMPMFQKITKMPLQKSFPFPKILNRKEHKKVKQENADTDTVIPAKKPELPKDKVTEEGRTVIDYYGSIVKEYGSQKKPVTQLYLNTEDLKEVAEQQEPDNETVVAEPKKTVKVKKLNVNTTDTKKPSTMAKSNNSVPKPPKSRANNHDNATKTVPKTENNRNTKDQKKYTQQIVLKKTERATIVIPIDYQELEKKAKITVRSVIDYTVDLCLLLLAFWVYFFKDERLAIPFLILIIYRQLQETILMNIPDWFKHHTPSWMKMKTS